MKCAVGSILGIVKKEKLFKRSVLRVIIIHHKFPLEKYVAKLNVLDHDGGDIYG